MSVHPADSTQFNNMSNEPLDSNGRQKSSTNSVAAYDNDAFVLPTDLERAELGDTKTMPSTASPPPNDSTSALPTVDPPTYSDAHGRPSTDSYTEAMKSNNTTPMDDASMYPVVHRTDAAPVGPISPTTAKVTAAKARNANQPDKIGRSRTASAESRGAAVNEHNISRDSAANSVTSAPSQSSRISNSNHTLKHKPIPIRSTNSLGQCLYNIPEGTLIVLLPGLSLLLIGVLVASIWGISLDGGAAGLICIVIGGFCFVGALIYWRLAWNKHRPEKLKNSHEHEPVKLMGAFMITDNTDTPTNTRTGMNCMNGTAATESRNQVDAYSSNTESTVSPVYTQGQSQNKKDPLAPEQPQAQAQQGWMNPAFEY